VIFTAADGSLGFTRFYDHDPNGTSCTESWCNWGHFDTYDVENIQSGGGGLYPSTGSDAHLIIADNKAYAFYDFFQLCTVGGYPAVAQTSSGVQNCPNLLPYTPPNWQQDGYATVVGEVTMCSKISGGTDSANGCDTQWSKGYPGGTGAQITGYAGDVLRGELKCGTCLNHAILIIVPTYMNANIHESPAQTTDGKCTPGTGTQTAQGCISGAPVVFEEGSKLALPSGFAIPPESDTPDGVNTVSHAVHAIMYALKNYGGVIVDQGGTETVAAENSIGFYTTNYVSCSSDEATPSDSNYDCVQTAASGVTQDSAGWYLIAKNLVAYY
jgi:hypothetical protein